MWDAVFAWWLPSGYPPLGGIRHEWHFRSYLDHYSSAIGMIFALNFPVAEKWLKVVEAMPSTQQWLIKGTGAVILIAATTVWILHVGMSSKFVFNARSPYTFFIPMLTYIYLRNISKWLRERHLSLFVFAGKITLETYLLQHHVLLTKNAKAVLVFFPKYPLFNLLIVATVYIFCAKCLYRLTLNLRAMLIPDEHKACVKYLKGLLYAIVAFFVVALSMQMTEVRSGSVVALFGILIGVLVMFILRGQVQDGDISIASISIVFFLGVALLCAFAGPVLQDNYNPVVAKTVPPPPNKKLFVGSFSDKGLFVLICSALMIFLADNFIGVNWLSLKLFGAGVKLNIDEIYNDLHEQLGFGKCPA